MHLIGVSTHFLKWNSQCGVFVGHIFFAPGYHENSESTESLLDIFIKKKKKKTYSHMLHPSAEETFRLEISLNMWS